METRQKLIQNLDRIRGKRLLVIGDIMLDHYQWGEVSRISPEAPVPVVYVEKETYSLGGAGNVARNIKSLGGEPVLISVAGDDDHCREIKKMLDREGIEHTIVSSRKRKTTVKTRVIGNSQQIVRVDQENCNDLEPGLMAEITSLIEKKGFGEYVLVSDYGKGMVNRKTLSALQDYKVVLDPKTKNFRVYKDLFLMTPNQKEAEEGSNTKINSNKDIISTGKKIMKTKNLENLLITVGPMGMVLFRSNKEILHFPTSARKVYDVTGAGDTVIATMGICLQAQYSLPDACMTANFAAGLVVGQVGTAAADRENLVQSIESMSQPEIYHW
ncbi:PfkB domain protein [Desulfonatronospira thiodismutans ASO3-1]|uniref:PfkB domain protein n=1 Tax=Desulfonatronospira thiodismutans ASO3-1 TaxID=555779 RepID=D6SP80_9BACT|nr:MULTISPECIES: bifunctional ADP-heptose synthase [Desulfonatronospira]EFI34556.1 PfkB domain protein [Desulfonatronospira thiodismutans ASO3-1]